jgi:putative hydrolase of the HAD superfamily
MRYKAIFFDWGGVVANDPGDEFLGELLSKIGASEKQKAEIFKTFMKRFMRGEISEQEYWRSLRDGYGLVIHASISEEFFKWKGLEANRDILNLVREARSMGLKAPILSNVIEPTYNAIAKAGYYDLFDGVIASCKVGYAKPENEIYRLALDRFGVTADESIFVDDKQSCLDPAHAMGFTTVLARNPDQIIADVRALLAE